MIRARYGNPGDRTAKVGIDFVTETDLEAEQAILDVVRAARPDDAFLGEEAGLLGDATADRTWLVDPLCGTLNFAARTPLVAVNVALRLGTATETAAVAEPFADEVSWTDGPAAYLRRDGVDEPLTPSALTRRSTSTSTATRPGRPASWCRPSPPASGCWPCRPASPRSGSPRVAARAT